MMRPIKVETSSVETNPTFEKFFELAKLKQLTPVQELNLLNEIKKGKE